MMIEYQYKRKSLTPEIATEIIRDNLKGNGSIIKIGDAVLKYHTERNGQPPDHSLNIMIWCVMQRLSQQGYVNRITKRNEGKGMYEQIWEIYPFPLRVFGDGRYAVYLFYDLRDYILRDKSKETWACKIGRTKRSVTKRVYELTKQWTIVPRIALIFKFQTLAQTKQMEKMLHNVLKAEERHRKDLKKKGAGREWFDTNPDEVVELFENIQKNIQLEKEIEKIKKEDQRR